MIHNEQFRREIKEQLDSFVEIIVEIKESNSFHVCLENLFYQQ